MIAGKLETKIEKIRENNARGDTLLERVFESQTQYLLNKGLDAASVRNRVIADNIANVDTPGFKRREVIFEENIRKVLQKSKNHDKLKVNDFRHMQIAPSSHNIDVMPEIRTMEDLTYRNDQNNVDIDVETAKLAKNKLLYDGLGQSMSNEIRLLRLAITGRG